MAHEGLIDPPKLLDKSRAEDFKAALERLEPPTSPKDKRWSTSSRPTQTENSVFDHSEAASTTATSVEAIPLSQGEPEGTKSIAENVLTASAPRGAGTLDWQPSCAICGCRPTPEFPGECDHESEALTKALQQAMDRWEDGQYVKDWTIDNAKRLVGRNFEELRAARFKHHTEYVQRLPCYSLYQRYRGNPPFDTPQLRMLKKQIVQAQQLFAQGVDEDWRLSCMNYPDVLDHYLRLVEVSFPGEIEDGPRLDELPHSRHRGEKISKGKRTSHGQDNERMTTQGLLQSSQHGRMDHSQDTPVVRSDKRSPNPGKPLSSTPGSSQIPLPQTRTKASSDSKKTTRPSANMARRPAGEQGRPRSQTSPGKSFPEPLAPSSKGPDVSLSPPSQRRSLEEQGSSARSSASTDSIGVLRRREGQAVLRKRTEPGYPETRSPR